MSNKIPAFFYHPDGYETSRPNLMGRHAAGEEFFKAICKYTPVEEPLYCYTQQEKFFQHFVQKVKSFADNERKLSWIPWSNWPALAQPGAIFTPGPVLQELAWQRRFVNQRLFSICGVTHTTATSRVMDSLGELLTSPVQPWDALICTSNCVRHTVRQVVSDQFEYLKERFGPNIRPPASIQLPVIPLGVDAKSYDVEEEKRLELRSKWRGKLKIEDDEFVLLFFGRLSFHGKAHPMPMYIAAEEAAKKSSKKFHLVLAGWFQNDAMKEHFVDAAKKLCPSIRVSFVDGRLSEVRSEFWYAADIFTSLSDNIQETFGLTPVEAMAAGLPVVISDWNGYKETVEEGKEGFLIPTWMTPPGLSEELAMAHAVGFATYDHYIGYQCQFTSVDVKACAAAYLKLSEDPALVSEMGIAGKKKALEVFDWAVILPKYQALWDTLDELRKNAPEAAIRRPGRAAYPLRNDPNVIFSSYPTNTLSPGTRILANEFTSRERLEQIAAIPMGQYAKELLYSASDSIALIERISGKSEFSAQELCSEVDQRQGRALLRTIAWLSKMGLVDLIQNEQDSKTDDTTGAIIEQLVPALSASL